MIATIHYMIAHHEWLFMRKPEVIYIPEEDFEKLIEDFDNICSAKISCIKYPIDPAITVGGVRVERI